MSGAEEKKLLWLWLANIRGIGPVKRRLLLQLHETPEALFEAGSQTLSQVFGQSPFRSGDLERFLASRDLKAVAAMAQRLEDKGIRFLTMEDEAYPDNLKRIEDAPAVLYARGTLAPRSLTIAIVGTRQMSPYGKQVAEHFARELSRAGVHVVSGMARGIDAAAQRSIVKDGGATTAVWGSGIDVCYPKEGKGLEEAILKCGGAILSEEGPGVPPSPGLFPRRNRIISGMSSGVVVVEAKQRSGSLITADCALEQGRDVFAVPGRIFDLNSEGCNHLVRMGAKPIFNVQDLLEEYPQFLSASSAEAPVLEKLLDGREKMVYSCIQWSPAYIDDLLRKTGLPFGELQLVLVKLEIEGLIKQLPNQYYTRNG